jgi:hypothetical protein
VAGPRDDGRQLGRADHEDPRRPESLTDHLADDLERRQNVSSGANPEAVQAFAQVIAGGAGVVGDEGERATAPVEGGEELARTRIEDAAIPDAPVEVEDEPAHGREEPGGHEPQDSADRAKSAIASW